MELDELARGLAALDGRVSGAIRGLDLLTAEPSAFGADGPGRLGEVGRALAAQHDEAITARRAEASHLVDVIDDLASAVSTAAANYRYVEDRRAGTR